MRPVLLTFIVLFAAIASPSHAGIIFQQNPMPNDTGAVSPGGDRLAAADDFTLGSTQTVAGIVFWGNKTNVLPSSTFNFNFYSDLSGVGVQYGSRQVSVANMIVSNTPSIQGFYEFRADFASPLTITAGTKYLSIVHDGVVDDWSWQRSTETSGTHYSFLASSGVWDTNLFSNNLAFQLHDTSVTPEPGSVVVLSIGAASLAFGSWKRRRKLRELKTSST